MITMSRKLAPGYVIPERLLTIIDEYRDTHGAVSTASVARVLGVQPQTISSWRTRGLKRPPEVEGLKKLTGLTGNDALWAVLLDLGWVEEA